MLTALPRLLLVMSLSTTLSYSWAAQAAESPPLPSGVQKVQTKNASAHHAPRARSATSKPVSTPVQVVKVAAAEPRAEASAQPSASAAASDPLPTPSSESRWQPPLAAAALMLVIALKRQGGQS